MENQRGLTPIGFLIAIVLYVVGGFLLYSAFLVTGVYGSTSFGLPTVGSTQFWEGVAASALLVVGGLVAWWL